MPSGQSPLIHEAFPFGLEATCTVLMNEDAGVRSSQPNSNYGSDGLMRVHPATAGGAVSRLFVQAPVLATANCNETGVPLPDGVDIIRAEMRLFINAAPDIRQEHVLSTVVPSEPWAEATLTWNNQPAVSGMYDSLSTTSDYQYWMRWDVTGQVPQLLSGSPHAGWRVSNADESHDPDGGNFAYYLAREHSIVADFPNGSPRLIITYAVDQSLPTPYEVVVLDNPNLSYVSMPAPCSGPFTAFGVPFGSNQMLVEDSFLPLFDRHDIPDMLAGFDAADHTFADIMGWEFTAATAFDHKRAIDGHKACADVVVAGVGTMGWWIGLQSLVGNVSIDAASSTRRRNWIVQHERIHQWDSSRSAFIFHADPAHAFTAAFESIAPSYVGTAFHSSARVPPPVTRYVAYNSSTQEYFEDASRNWATYFSDAALAIYNAGESGFPKQAVSLGLQGALLDWIDRVHGKQGLRAVLNEVDQDRIALGFGAKIHTYSPTPQEVNDQLLRYISDGLGVDGRHYFAYWKFPISSTMDAYLDGLGYPPGIGTLDQDGDGFTPLQGDFVDTDRDVFPGAPELPDHKDNNLDGQIDELVILESAEPSQDLPSAASQRAVTLPALIRGEIATLGDADSFEITLERKQTLLFTLQSVGSEAATSFNSSGHPIDSFVGSLSANGVGFLSINLPWRYGTVVFPKGTHAISINAAQTFGHLPAMPGHYVVQAFVDEQAPVELDTGLPYGPFKPAGFGPLRPDASFGCADAIDVPEAQCNSLVSIYRTLGGGSWVDTRGWLTTNRVCKWRGISCDGGGISRLQLQDIRGLHGAGDLSKADWSGLGNLKLLDLWSPDLVGPLPDALLAASLERLNVARASICVPTSHLAWYASIPEATTLPTCADADGDGIVDVADASPTVALGGRTDTDGDGAPDDCDTSCLALGLVADDDDDGDGMPDSFEATNGLDPLLNDAMSDLDGDGRLNIHEFVEDMDVTADDVPPVLTVPSDITATSTGVSTAVNLGIASAIDYKDGTVVPTADPSGPFAPGRSVITWTAVDAAGNVASDTQIVDVVPLVSIEAAAEAIEGTTGSATVRLNGEPTSYPVVVPYSIGGTAQAPEDHDLADGEVTITSGTSGLIDFGVVDDGFSDDSESLEITLGSPMNAVIEPPATGTVLLRDAGRTVGGTVTGLAGTGLVLQNNTGDDLSVIADGPFTFALPLTDGQAYDVTAVSQPSALNQICTVTQGIGTVAGASISNIAVACVTNQYSVGGAVSGLVGTGLTLQLSGGNDLAIALDGSFEFPNALADGTSFEVTVLSQPSSPVQSCTANNHTGTLTGADYHLVAISCANAPERCNGEQDEDADGLVDCNDPDCADSSDCETSAPASPSHSGCSCSGSSVGSLWLLLPPILVAFWHRRSKISRSASR